MSLECHADSFEVVKPAIVEDVCQAQLHILFENVIC